ncbi:hypothetical protein [Virgibacillus ihumii]|uniref:hypothetical protein n=1 Tax=Virgibacillus ihumii TaxID=2686091 RepID=UPI00157D0DB4|nr:hypothetical protein [Virgibacillus ihumii]
MKTLYSVSEYFVNNWLAILAFIISFLSFMDAKNANKVLNRVQELEEKLKLYELEEKEEAQKACVEARVVKISKNNYKLKIWNSGKATAFNVDFEVSGLREGNIFKEKVPYEFLEGGKYFEESVMVAAFTVRKFNVKTMWNDKSGDQHHKEQIVSM